VLAGEDGRTLDDHEDHNGFLEDVEH